MPPPEETEETLGSLVNELIAEDGKDVAPDTLTLCPVEDKRYPPHITETNVQEGLTDDQVIERRKEYGRNSLTQDKRNPVLKFLGFFNGPIQWVMEVSMPLKQIITDTGHLLTSRFNMTGRYRAGCRSTRLD